MNSTLRSTATFALMLATVFSAVVPLLAGYLIASASVGHSRLFAGSVIAFWMAAVSCVFWVLASEQRRWWVWGVAVGLLGGAGLAAAAYQRAPSGKAPAASPFQSVSVTGQDLPYFRISPVNLVAEVDQLQLGVRLFSAIDPYIDMDRARRLRDSIDELHGEMRADGRGWDDTGCHLLWCYREILGFPYRFGHSYVYVPPGAKAPAPVLVFLHGSLGNFKSYLWVLKPLADELGMAVVAPSFGVGNWDQPGGVETVRDVLEFCRGVQGLDPSRVVIAGLSNGGLGVSGALGELADEFRGFVFISPVIRPDRAGEVAAGTPVLVIYGTDDLRVPPEHVEAGAVQLEGKGASVTIEDFSGEDHFLFFTQREKVLATIRDWMKSEVTIP